MFGTMNNIIASKSDITAIKTEDSMFMASWFQKFPIWIFECRN